jgi:hypothetical protein
MNSIQLEVINKTKSNSVHLKLIGDKEDLGILYLTESQLSDILQIFRAGCFNKDIDISINDPYNDDEEDSYTNKQNFFSID